MLSISMSVIVLVVVAVATQLNESVATRGSKGRASPLLTSVCFIFFLQTQTSVPERLVAHRHSRKCLLEVDAGDIFLFLKGCNGMGRERRTGWGLKNKLRSSGITVI